MPLPTSYLQAFEDGDIANDRYIVSSNITIDGRAGDIPDAPDNVTLWDWSLTAGADSVVGSSAIDRLATGNGNDTVDGGAGTDILYGGAADDTYYLDTYLDSVVELIGQGIDTVISTSSYIMASNVENLTLAMGAGLIDGLGNGADNVISGNDSGNGMAGGAGNDTIFGNGGDDAIDGGTGADSMIGGSGVDTYYVDSAGDHVVETEAGPGLYDTVWTSLANYTLPANVEIYIAIGGAGSIAGTGNDEVTLMLGNEGANILHSMGGNDIVLGRDGIDTINGGAGELDILSGGLGADLLTGGGGHDYFNYEFIEHGGDTITDFATGAGIEDDILDLRPMFQTFTNTAGVSNSGQAVASGHLTYTQAGANVEVYADANGGAHEPGEQVLMATVLNQTAASVQAYTLI